MLLETWKFDLVAKHSAALAQVATLFQARNQLEARTYRLTYPFDKTSTLDPGLLHAVTGVSRAVASRKCGGFALVTSLEADTLTAPCHLGLAYTGRHAVLTKNHGFLL